MSGGPASSADAPRELETDRAGTAAPDAAAPDAAPGSPRPQRLVLVLPSTAEFDSRTHRIAAGVAARGHRVTVLARSAPGLPTDVETPAGYRIIRSRVSAIDGLPLPAAVRRMIATARRRSGRRSPGGPAGDVSGPGQRAVVGARGGRSRRLLGSLRRAVGAAWRMTAIGLTVRAQSLAARRDDPGGDVYHSMAYMGIPVGLDLGSRSGGRVVYDARDIYVDAGNLARLPRPARWLLARIERRWARRADAVVTVNRPYAEVMAARWDVPLPVIVLNCALPYERPRRRPRRIGEQLGIPPARRIVLYQGGFSPDRGIEQLIEAIADVPEDAVLVLLGYGVLDATLRRMAEEPDSRGRIHVLPAVPPTELLDWVASADIVAMPIQPTTLNHRLTTPNKLFEAMAAGVPVIASDLPGMSGIVTEAGLGLLVDPRDPAAIAAAIRRLLALPAAERAAYRERALRAARESYSWDRQLDRLLELYGQLTGRPW